MKRETIPKGNEDESLAELRNAVAPGVDHARLDPVPHLLEFMDHQAQDQHVAFQRHLGDVLHQDRARSDPADDLEEGAPQFPALILAWAAPREHELLHERTPRSGEWLAGRPPSDQVDPDALEKTARTLDDFGISKIGIDGQAREEMAMGLQGLPGVVDTIDHPEARLLEAETDSPGPREEVGSEERALLAEPLREAGQLPRVLDRVGMGRQFDEGPTNQLHANPPSGLTPLLATPPHLRPFYTHSGRPCQRPPEDFVPGASTRRHFLVVRALRTQRPVVPPLSSMSFRRSRLPSSVNDSTLRTRHCGSRSAPPSTAFSTRPTTAPGDSKASCSQTRITRHPASSRSMVWRRSRSTF
jgi:hypothetical protein